jgi:mannose/fructose/N-acetylgalactosamine-specific phosphotransferase system component IIC
MAEQPIPQMASEQADTHRDGVIAPVHLPNAKTAEHPRQRPEIVAAGIGVAGWLLPGLGHALQKMWGRAAACFLTVGLLVLLGVGMRGNIFTSDGGDAFGMLGYLADLGTGSFYFAAKSFETHGSDVAHAAGDYGTRFLAAAGVLNLLAALHAYEAARGRKA